MSVKRIWNYSDKWGIGVQPQKSHIIHGSASDSIQRGILTLNPFGSKVRTPKLNLPSDEFIKYEKPVLPAVLKKILKNLK